MITARAGVAQIVVSLTSPSSSTSIVSIRLASATTFSMAATIGSSRPSVMIPPVSIRTVASGLARPSRLAWRIASGRISRGMRNRLRLRSSMGMTPRSIRGDDCPRAPPPALVA